MLLVFVLMLPPPHQPESENTLPPPAQPVEGRVHLFIASAVTLLLASATLPMHRSPMPILQKKPVELFLLLYIVPENRSPDVSSCAPILCCNLYKPNV